MSAACTSSFDALVAEASRLAAEAETGEVDHDAITSLTEDILAAIAELTPEQAQHLHGIVGALTLTVQTRRDAVRSQLGGVAHKGRAIRGFGKSDRYAALFKGQRVNTGV